MFLNISVNIIFLVTDGSSGYFEYLSDKKNKKESPPDFITSVFIGSMTGIRGRLL